jgi:hypothetical protein
MDGIRGIIPLLVRIAKVREVLRPGVPVEKYDMGGVGRADGAVDSVVKCNDTGVRRVGGLVERVIALRFTMLEEMEMKGTVIGPATHLLSL